MSLIDKIQGLEIGDVVRLSNVEETCVVGHVKSYDSDSIILSPQDPRSYEKWVANSTFRLPRGLRHFDSSTRYKLKHFDSYEVLKFE